MMVAIKGVISAIACDINGNGCTIGKWTRLIKVPVISVRK
jgi:hypothetical protein